MSGKFTFINYEIRKGLETFKFFFEHASCLLSGERAYKKEADRHVQRKKSVVTL